jgi:hypothetical protein
MPLLAIFQLYHGYLVLLVEYTEKTADTLLFVSFSVAFLHQNDERICYEVAHLFILFLFDELAKFDLG